MQNCKLFLEVVTIEGRGNVVTLIRGNEGDIGIAIVTAMKENERVRDVILAAAIMHLSETGKDVDCILEDIRDIIEESRKLFPKSDAG